MTATSSSSDVGGIVGYYSNDINLDDVYKTGTIIENGVEVTGTNIGIFLDDLSIFDESFFLTVLGFDPDLWNFTNLNVSEGIYPTLKATY